MTDYPFILVENFENNTATGTVTVKLTVTKDGASASSTKVFTVAPLKKDSAGGENVEGLNAYANNIFERGALNFDKITSFDHRQNMVLSKEGVVFHRAYGSGNLFCVEVNGKNNFQVDFDYTPFARTGNQKVSFCMNYRTGNWNGYNSSQSAFYSENGAATITAGYWGGKLTQSSGDGPTVEFGKVIKIRFTHTVSNGVATFDYKWSTDGETYNDWLNYTVNTSNTQADMGAAINAIQFNYEDGSFRMGNVKLTTL